MKCLTLVLGLMLVSLLTVPGADSQMTGETTAGAVFAVR